MPNEDFSNVELRFVRALVQEKANDLFFVIEEEGDGEFVDLKDRTVVCVVFHEINPSSFLHADHLRAG